MPITFDHSDIQDALETFDIKQDDYYILCMDACVYIVWCTKGDKALGFAENNGCVSLDVKGEWFYAEELPPGFKPDPLICVRYILATI
jgi:hypothetical protein